jgi:integrase
MPFSRNRTPAYRLHKGSGQAVVTLDGRDIYLGVHGTKTSRDEYDRAIAEWLANGRSLRPANFADVTITEVLARFWDHVETYYRLPDGSPSSEIHVYRSALSPLRRLYGHTLAREFGPLALKTLRGEMIRLGWCRKVVNKQMGRIKNAFKWAVANELIPPSVFHGLAAVNGLRAGRSDAPESEPVQPVPEEYIRAVFPHVSAQIRKMIEVQLLTGMRPGEVCMMRGCDIDTTGRLWTYRPAHHKTEHHGHKREIYLGPRAQELIGPFLKPDLQAYLFSPIDAETARREERHAFRKTPLKYGNRPGTNRRKNPKRAAGSRFTVC